MAIFDKINNAISGAMSSMYTPKTTAPKTTAPKTTAPKTPTQQTTAQLPFRPTMTASQVPYAPEYVPPAPTATKPKTSSTVLSNQTKIDQIPKMNNQLSTLSQKGVTTDTASGISTFADGSPVPQPKEEVKTTVKTPKYEESVKVDTSQEDAQIDNYFNSLKSNLDAQTAGIISNIQNQFAQYKTEQRDINMRSEKGVQNALLMGGVTGGGGSAKYAPISSEGIIQSQVSYGLKQIANLEAQEQQLIIQAQIAQQQGNFQIMEKQLALAQQKRNDKVKEAARLNDDIAKRNEELRKQNEQFAMDAGVAELYSSGITDPTIIQQQLGAKGVYATTEQIKSTVSNITPDRKDINDIVLKAAQAGASPETLARIGQARNFNEAIAAAGTALATPTTQLTKLDNGNTVLVNTKTGQVIRNIGGAAPSESTGGTYVGTTQNLDEIYGGDIVSQVAATIKDSKFKPNEQTTNVINVLSGLQDFANLNPSGEFAGLKPGIRTPNILASEEKLANRSAIEAINLKVQIWASGAALTSDQTKQVEKITPQKNDTDREVRSKTNQLTNYMLGQVKGQMAGQGIDYQPPKIDFFSKDKLPENPYKQALADSPADIYNPEQGYLIPNQ